MKESNRFGLVMAVAFVAVSAVSIWQTVAAWPNSSESHNAVAVVFCSIFAAAAIGCLWLVFNDDK